MSGRARAIGEVLGDGLWALRRCLRIVGAARLDSVRRIALLALALPALALVSALHGLAYLLDELFVPRYRDTPVERPVFVVGMPRSGTTFLQEALAADEARFSTIRLRELLFTPALSQRFCWAAIARFDRAIGRPLERIGRWIERKSTHGLDDVHPIDLDAPEEDFLFLLPVWACFALVALVPESRDLWSLTRVDASWSNEDRARLARWYRRSVQRQLYWDRRTRSGAPPRVLLSKNPSFTGMVMTLRDTFPDAAFVCCYREASKALASQLSSMAPSMELFGRDPKDAEIRDRFEEMYVGYSESILELKEVADGHVQVVPLRTLSADVKATVVALYRQLGLAASPDYLAHLDSLRERSRGYRSKHRYTAADFGLDPAAVDQRFAPFIQALDGHALATEPA